MPIDYSKYPADWQQIRARILERAGDKCEFCGVPNRATGYRDRNGEFHCTDGLATEAATLDGERVFMVVLTVAHLNHDIADNRPENLRALCQKCHLDHDKNHHRASRFNNKTHNIPDLPGLGE